MSQSSDLLRGSRVLIVEDRYLIASELERGVRRLGGTVVGPVRNVEAASGLLASGPIDLALLDVNLDGELVFPVAEALAERGTPFIFVTGYDEWDWPKAWADRPRLCKPVNHRQLQVQLSRLFGGT